MIVTQKSDWTSIFRIGMYSEYLCFKYLLIIYMDSVPKNFAKDVNKFFESEESVAFVVKKMNLNLGLYQGKGDFDAIIYRNPGDTTKRASLPKINSSSPKTQKILDRFENNGCILLKDYEHLVSKNRIDKNIKVADCSIHTGPNDYIPGVKKSGVKKSVEKEGTADPYLPVLGIAHGRGGKRRKTKRKRPNTRSRQNRKFST